VNGPVDDAAGGNARSVGVRVSTENDVPAMLAIYTHHITRGLGEVDPEPTPADDIKRRRNNMLRRRVPYLVVERDGVVVGYAYAVPFRKRSASAKSACWKASASSMVPEPTAF